jgi:hypothetical protein
MLVKTERKGRKVVYIKNETNGWCGQGFEELGCG